MKNTEQPSLRLDAYIRVSDVHGREGERFISPKQQEDRIRSWADAHGHEIIRAHAELDVSGGKMDRPMLNEVMRRIDAGETDGVVVFKLDRFGRTLIGSLQLIERISARGALFASVSDGFDITTETGRLVLRILLSLAEFELERIRRQWREARAEAVHERGWHISAMPPYGYRRDVEVDKKGRTRPTGPLILDPVEAPVVERIFRLRAGGMTWAQIRKQLNADGVRTREANRWHDVHLRRMTTNRAYLGVASGGHAGDAAKPDAHPAIVDEETWHTVQNRHTPRAAPDGDSGSVVRGLVRCAGCRYMMVAQPKPGRTGTAASITRTRAAAPRRPTSHHRPATGITASTTTSSTGCIEENERVEFEAVDVDLADLRETWETALARHDEALDDVELEDALGRRAYLRRVEALRADAEAKGEVYEDARRASGVLDTPIAELRRMWPELPLDVKRKHLARTVRHVFVRPREDGRKKPSGGTSEKSRRADFDRRVRVVFAGERDVDVPRQGRRDFVSEPFTDFPA